MQAPHGRVASLVAGVGFTYTLIVTTFLVFSTSFFVDDVRPNTVLAWLTVPIVSSFCGWLCVRQADPILRILVWFFVLATLFFCWISIFSIGPYYLPTVILLTFAALGPWDSETAAGGMVEAGQKQEEARE